MQRLLLLTTLVMMLCAGAQANDLNQSTWSETDSSNNAPAPNGWPAGMLPSQVEPTSRAGMGATKRWYNHANCTATSTGTGNSQVLTYSVAPQALVAGDQFCFQVGTGLTNTGATTLNINGLGAKALASNAGTALVGGELNAGSYAAVVYDGLGFRLISQTNSVTGGFSVTGALTVSGGATVSGGLSVLGSNIALDNNHAYLIKDTGGTYRDTVYLDPSNNLHIGENGLSGNLLFQTNGAIEASLDGSGNFNILGQYRVNGSQIACGNLAGSAPSCSTDTTNASHITSGTLPAGRLSGPYQIGNLTVSNTFGGGGGNIALDNNQSLLLKDNGGTYRNGLAMDVSNNVHVGDTSVNTVCFYTTGSNCAARVDAGANFVTTASINFPHGQIGYNTGTPNYVVLQNVGSGTYVALLDSSVAQVTTPSGTCAYASGTSWACSSDARFKIVEPLDNFAGVMSLKPVSYHLKEDPHGSRHFGFTAQDVERVYPELVSVQNGKLSLEYTGLIAPLVAKVQELSHHVDELEAKLKKVENR